MLSRKCLITGGAVALSLVLIAVGAQGQSRRREAPASGASSQGGDKTVLDLASPWRLHTSLKPPLVREGAGVKPLAMPQRWMMWESPEPPADWAQADFDDGSWLRGPASRGGASPRVAR
ncbi:MAG TPA: hypothetical protein PLP01_09780, partial [Phycisphaerae bacterium]|nr:hypothetical protein [Phycisphaerae bacterium]